MSKYSSIPNEILNTWLKTLEYMDHQTSFTEKINTHVQTIEHLWETFNQDRSQLSPKLLNHREAMMAYLLGFQLPNIGRALSIWKEAFQRNPKAFSIIKEHQNQNIDILDFGCGLGAMSQAGLYFLKSQELLPNISKTIIHLYDQTKPLLDVASFGIKTLEPELTENIRICKTSIADLKMSYFQKPSLKIVFLGYVANELASNPKAQGFLTRLFELLASTDHPTFIVITEPSKKFQSRNLSRTRDFLAEIGYQVLYPCPQGVSACPLSQSGRDWCFSEFFWNPPKEQITIDQKTGMKRSEFITTSGMLFVKNTSLDSKRNQKDEDIVIGRPKDEEGKGFSYLLCTDQGLKKTPKKTLSQTYRRGQVFQKKI